MKQNNVKVAITGGIGSGKTAVGNIIKRLGYNVYSCDEIYNALLAQKEFLNKISNAFGNEFISNGVLDRKKLADLVFADKLLLKKLNSITHPAVMTEAFNRMEVDQLAFCEVPLLFENGYEDYFNETIVVMRDKDKRIAAVSQRDKLSENDIENRIKVQFNYDNLDFAKYYVIHNSGNLQNLELKTKETVQNIVKKYF